MCQCTGNRTSVDTANEFSNYMTNGMGIKFGTHSQKFSLVRSTK